MEKDIKHHNAINGALFMEHYSELCAHLDTLSVRYIKDAPLRDYSTFRIGGAAGVVVLPESEAELIETLKYTEKSGIKYIVIGNGSNLLFSDDGYDGAVITTVNMKKLTADNDNNRINAECGASVIAMSLAAARSGLSGLEFAYGIPGSCGGGVFMNAGAYGSQFSDVIDAVRCFDTDRQMIINMTLPELELDYRHSVFMEKKNLIIFSATFALKTGNRDEIEAKMREIMKKRRDNQPLEYPSAGSVFKRKSGYFMGRIIEESGLKGYSLGGAEVSQKHAGFIINKGGATANDVLGLIEHIKDVILKNYGFEAECEIRYIN